MLIEDVNSIDRLINSIKDRASKSGFLKIDIRFILLLEVVRLELFTKGEMSDPTAGAVAWLFTFQAHEFFYRDFRELWDECAAVSSMLDKYNEKYSNYENLPNPTTDEKKWATYFNKAISNLLTINKPSVTELDSINSR